MSDTFDEKRITTATFLFEVDGQEIGRFMEVSGLQVDVEVEEIQEGGQNAFVHRLPGRMTWPNIVLRRGVTKSDNLFAWLEKSSGEQFAANGNKLTRATAAITLLSRDGERLRAWEFDGAFPVRWKGPDFSADAMDIAVEEIEITHHGFRAKNLA